MLSVSDSQSEIEFGILGACFFVRAYWMLCTSLGSPSPAKRQPSGIGEYDLFYGLIYILYIQWCLDFYPMRESGTKPNFIKRPHRPSSKFIASLTAEQKAWTGREKEGEKQQENTPRHMGGRHYACWVT